MCLLRLVRCSLYEGLGLPQGGHGAIGAIFGMLNLLLDCPPSPRLFSGFGSQIPLTNTPRSFSEGSEVFSTIATFDHSNCLCFFLDPSCLLLRVDSDEVSREKEVGLPAVKYRDFPMLDSPMSKSCCCDNFPFR